MFPILTSVLYLYFKTILLLANMEMICCEIANTKLFSTTDVSFGQLLGQGHGIRLGIWGSVLQTLTAPDQKMWAFHKKTVFPTVFKKTISIFDKKKPFS